MDWPGMHPLGNLYVFNHGALQYKEMNNRIGPTVNLEWNVAMLVLPIFWFFHKHNSIPFGPIQPSSPNTKELHGSTLSRPSRWWSWWPRPAVRFSSINRISMLSFEEVANSAEKCNNRYVGSAS